MKDKEKYIEEMINDIGPERQIEHNGQKISCIFYDKATLAKVLVARGWEKLSEDGMVISKEEYQRLKSIEYTLDEFTKTDVTILPTEEYELLTNIKKKFETADGEEITAKELLEYLKDFKAESSKETAEKLLNDVNRRLNNLKRMFNNEMLSEVNLKQCIVASLNLELECIKNFAKQFGVEIKE